MSRSYRKPFYRLHGEELESKRRTYERKVMRDIIQGEDEGVILPDNLRQMAHGGGVFDESLFSPNWKRTGKLERK